ncbi:hypothetical protein [Hypericibacter terrae]|jgi:hypothetical protein|uniref:hypothetical protein n=1 Tax=Hypericibacter terrae TaxID=2602015 RepID=UPI00177D6AAC|nr:hypothetical protein [Hypericibacter terrae]
MGEGGYRSGKKPKETSPFGREQKKPDSPKENIANISHYKNRPVIPRSAPRSFDRRLSFHFESHFHRHEGGRSWLKRVHCDFPI